MQVNTPQALEVKRRSLVVMGYRLRMSAEIYDWLAELRDSDPPSAVLVVGGLAALADKGDYLGLPLVALVDGRPRPDDLPSALDVRYQAWLESLTGMRRQLADAETDEEKQRLTEACHQEQLRADTFRARKEILRAALIAAQAEEVLDPARAAARLDEITSMIEPELDLEPPAEGLLELRPGAPATSGIRILFAVEPPGTALLIAVMEGDDVIRDHYHEAVRLASEALREARSGQAPEAADRTFDDAQSLLAELLPRLDID
jgi:hypothetical protein